MFKLYPINFATTFGEVLAGHCTELLSKDRQCAVLVHPQINLDKTEIPLVRTTAQYSLPPQPFGLLDLRIRNEIAKLLPTQKILNHATLEIYNDYYRTMKYHTDQYLDIEKDSFFALFTLYEDPQASPSRVLICKNKLTGATHEIELAHNTVVTFSYETNHLYLHKIVVAPNLKRGNRWLGLTFRTAKTFLELDDRGKPLNIRLASELEAKQLYNLKHNENKNATDIYEDGSNVLITMYTLSSSDLLPFEGSPIP